MVRRRSSLLVVVALALSVVSLSASDAVVATPEPLEPVALAFTPTGAHGEFHPLTPQRIYDSRNPGIGTAPGAKVISPEGGIFDVQVLGVGGVPAPVGQVYAVVANITVIQPTVDGVLSTWPTGEDPPNPMTSNTNYKQGQIVPNLALLRPGDAGRVRMWLQAQTNGQAHVIVDVFGWVSTSNYPTRGARLISIVPGRLYDSRQSGGPLAAGTSRSVMVRGATSSTFTVPNNSDVVGAVLNVTGINNRAESTSTYISVLPTAPVGLPSTSNLNLPRGVTRANLVVVPVGPDGNIHFYNAAGSANVAADLVGYLINNRPVGTREGRIIPLRAPFRAIDTRVGPSAGRLPPGQAESWSFEATINSTSVPDPVSGTNQPIGNVASLIGNLTGTGFVRQYYNSPINTYLSVTPFVSGTPTNSNLNFGIGEAVANLAVGQLSLDQEFWVYNAEGYVHYLFDIAAMVLAD